MRKILLPAMVLFCAAAVAQELQPIALPKPQTSGGKPLMEALAETLWEAQRAGRPPDESRYLALARGRVSRSLSE